MKAVEYTRYGAADVLQLTDVPQPLPKPGEILIKVHATTVTAADIMMRVGKPLIGRLYLGIKGPKRKVLGFEFAGVVVGLGESVSLFKVGDRVFGGTTTLGCYAEYVCVSEKDVVTTLPDNVAYAEAAPVSGSAITALHFLKGMAHLQKGQKVLINGASGGVGTYAVQIAKLLGADVTAVCSTANVPWVQALGADRVIDYTQADFTQATAQYDVIFDTVGKRTFGECKNALTNNGIFLSTVVNGGLMGQMLWTAIFGRKKAKSGSTGMLPVKIRLGYLLEIKAWMQAGQLKTVIDHQTPLAQMAEAHRYVEQGHKKGSMVIAV